MVEGHCRKCSGYMTINAIRTTVDSQVSGLDDVPASHTRVVVAAGAGWAADNLGMIKLCAGPCREARVAVLAIIICGRMIVCFSRDRAL